MNTYAWATDIHLDKLKTNEQVIEFGEALTKGNPSGVFITGDISNAKEIGYHLGALEQIVQRPIYFVLGNHDYFGGRTTEVRKQMANIGNASVHLRYLPTTPYVVLSPETAIVGHDCWYDCLYGDVANSHFLMPCFERVGDYYDAGAVQVGQYGQTSLVKSKLIETARKLAHEGVVHIQNGIRAAAKYHKRIVILTHVPPFEKSHIFNNAVGTPDAQPWFTCKMLGDLLLEAAKTYPNVAFDVYCGHTHGEHVGMYAQNLRVHVGGASYGKPKVQTLIEIG